jgi:hypothetical protein
MSNITAKVENIRKRVSSYSTKDRDEIDLLWLIALYQDQCSCNCNCCGGRS